MNLPKLIRVQYVFNRNFGKKYSTMAKMGPIFNIQANKHLPVQVCSCRFVSTVETAEKKSLVVKILEKLPFFKLHSTRVRVAAYMLYEEIVDKTNYVDFFHILQLPDTFYSWFVVTELHIWMLSVRAMAEGQDGRELRNGLVEALWADVDQRVKKIGAVNPAEMRAKVFELSEQLQAALIAYDEGLQSDDVVLAGAIWRRMYQRNYVDPENLEILVKYVRKQITLLDNLGRTDLFVKKAVNWEPLILNK